MTAYLALLIALLGLILFLAPLPAKVCEAGKITYFVGLFVTVLNYAGHAVKLL